MFLSVPYVHCITHINMYYMKNHFSHKGLFGSQTKCFMAIPILSDYRPHIHIYYVFY